MAFQASDGRGFTNRPQMKQHEARMAQKKPHAPMHEAKSQTQGGAGHMKCPHCGGDVELAKAGNQGEAGDMAPGNDAAGDMGF